LFCDATASSQEAGYEPAAGRGRQLAQFERGGLEPDDHQGEAGVAFCSNAPAHLHLMISKKSTDA
jgi:hypothetical protein